MSTANDTVFDPRERLMIIGNRLLDLVYKLDATAAAVKPMQEAKNDSAALDVLMKEEGSVDVLIRHITVCLERDSALKEYILLRQTIEAMESVRPGTSL